MRRGNGRFDGRKEAADSIAEFITLTSRGVRDVGSRLDLWLEAQREGVPFSRFSGSDEELRFVRDHVQGRRTLDVTVRC